MTLSFVNKFYFIPFLFLRIILFLQNVVSFVLAIKLVENKLNIRKHIVEIIMLAFQRKKDDKFTPEHSTHPPTHP
jgi:hypothetical protein